MANRRGYGVARILILFVAGCGGGGGGADDAATPDTGGDTGGPNPCTSDADCDDGTYCNGSETCAPSDPASDASGCVAAAASPCAASQTCSEADRRCVSDCELAPDADGDGHDATSCGGDDCDDADGTRFPGNAEVCDPGDVDEDCNPLTFGATDADMDGYVDSACCNVDAGGLATCGDDCDDTEAAVHPTETEVCDTVDNDCDGDVDEDGTRIFFPDADGDGLGDPDSALELMQCAAPMGFVAVSGDCNDADATTYEGALEACDGVDNDCSLPGGMAGGADAAEDGDGDGHAPPGASCAGAGEPMAPAAAFPKDDCDDADATTFPGAPELCDLIDNDCSSGGGADPAEDVDADGFASPASGCAGGALMPGDCNDADDTVHPGAPELCDAKDNDCDAASHEEMLRPISPCADGQSCIGGQCGLVRQIGAGFSHTCILLYDGQVRCWGNNDTGQLGDGTTTGSDAPRAVRGLTDVVQLEVGAVHNCAVRSDGTVWCWGDNAFAQMGDGVADHGTTCNGLFPGADCSLVPVQVSGIDTAVSVTAGVLHSCALLAGGALTCWGHNAAGQLGDGSQVDHSVPVSVTVVSGAASVAAGPAHTCAALDDGTVRCWGVNAAGVLGDGITDHGLTCTVLGTDADCSLDAVTVSGLDMATALTAAEHVCARRSDGTVYCWGMNDRGQLGDGSVGGQSAVPVMVSGLAGAVDVYAGLDHTCAVRGDGVMKCWGWNNVGQLGDATQTASPTPTTVSDVRPGLRIAAGVAHSCAIFVNGEVACWGSNFANQLGHDLGNMDVVPRSVGRLLEVVDVGYGTRHACALLNDRTVRCWGYNNAGQLGDGTTLNDAVLVPAPATGLFGAVDVALGDVHSCAHLVDGTVRCWGWNGDGQLGDGTVVNRSVPTLATAAGSDVEQLFAASDYTCALDTGGTITCWGTALDPSATTLVNPTHVSPGAGHLCGLFADGSVACGGANASGQLGDGTTMMPSTSVMAMISGAASGIGLGGAHSCAVLVDGTAECWGANAGGQLGDGTTDPSATPVLVTGLTGATQIDAGGIHSCAVLSDYRVQCWGFNALGELGDGTLTPHGTPADVVSLPDARSVYVRGRRACAISAEGDLYCWGWNIGGVLGLDPALVNESSVPVLIGGLE